MIKPAAEPSRAARPWPERLAPAGLFALPFLLYSGTCGFDLLGYDDYLYYFGNPDLRGGAAAGCTEIWRHYFFGDYAPIMQLSYWFDLAVFGHENWCGARLHNLFWFGLCVLAVRALGERVTGMRGRALAAALLFAVHPVCTESAVWLAERKNVIALALSLWSMERYLAARSEESPTRAFRLGGVAFVLFVLAMLAKVHALVVPAVLAGHEALLSRGAWKTRAARLAPFAAAAAILTWIKFAGLAEQVSGTPLGGSRMAAISSSGPVMVRYLGHTVAPWSLSFFYHVPELEPFSAFGWGAWALVGALAAAAIAFSRRRTVAAFCWAAALVSIGPAINLAAQPLPMADHYHIWALPFLLMGLAEAAGSLLERLPERQAKWAGALLSAGVAASFALVAFFEASDYEDRVLVYEKAKRREPDSALAWSLYAMAAEESPDPEVRAYSAPACFEAMMAPDAARLNPFIRSFIVQRVALSWYLRGEDGKAREILDRECARFTGPFERLGLVSRAWVAANSGRPREAIELLQPSFGPAQQAAVPALRERCRTGELLPADLPPMAPLSLADADGFTRGQNEDLIAESWMVLGSAFMVQGDLERAFDVAAVTVNTAPQFRPARQLLSEVYIGLERPDAAKRIWPGAPPWRFETTVKAPPAGR